MTDISSTTPSENEDDATSAAPARRPRRRAASRPAGPPVATDDAPAAAAEPSAPAAEPSGSAEPSAPAAEAAPAKKAARKRAPRKATAPAASVAPVEPVSAADPAAAEPAPEATTDAGVPAEVADAPRAARKRAPRKRAAAAAPVVDPEVEPEVIEPEVAETLPLDEDEDEVVEAPSQDDATASASPAVAAPAVPLLFQAPDPAAAPPRRRRRASAPAGPPVAHDDDAPAESDTAAAPVQPTRVNRSDAETRAVDPTDDDADSTDSTDETPDDTADDGTGAGRKRRRRGGRGRRPRGEDESAGEGRSDAAPDAAGTPDGDTGGEQDSSQQQGDDDADSDDQGDDESGSASSRRRRRRRRRSGSGNGGDAEAETTEDPPGTVTRVRQPRKAEDEVASVRGSTRLEAKKQRRRDGREAGRRKPTITESEFLARRESVQRAMVVRESAGRTQIAVLEDGVLVEHYVANETNASMIGNVYLGRVQNVLPSMEAAFVDIGKGRNAVLYAGEVNWDAAGLDGQPRRIESALKSGDTVLVQVTKDPMGHKGARLTSQISLPGRYLVYVPNSSMTGISRKLPDTERSRLKRILKAVVPEKAGVIVRTAAEGASEDELGQDVERLTGQWAEIEKKAASSSGGAAPKLLYGEPDLTIRVVRDVFNEDFTSLVVSGEAAWGVVQPYLRNVAPDLADRVTRWTSDADVFAEHRIDEQLLKAMDRKVWLPSGGSLVIDRTEAMTVVDVNTGKFTGSGGNLEETVTRNNLEAAEEVVRQLRLRDIGGIIVVDFIDMVLEGNRDLVLRRLLECLGRDRTKHQVAEVTSLGLVQMTRKRVGQGLLEVFSEPCEHCQGRGVVIHAEPVDRRSGDSGSGGQAPAESGGQGRSGGGSSSRRGRGGRGSEPAAPPEPPPVRQPIPAGFMASLVHHDTPASATSVDQPSSVEEPGDPQVEPVEPVDAPVEQPTVTVTELDVQPDHNQPDVQPDVEPDAEPARPARRRRRASAPSGPPIVHE